MSELVPKEVEIPADEDVSLQPVKDAMVRANAACFRGWVLIGGETQSPRWIDNDLPGVQVTEARIDACVAAIDASVICEVTLGVYPRACEFLNVGVLLGGQPCIQGAQCASGTCDIDDVGCGSCALTIISPPQCFIQEDCASGEVCFQSACVDGKAIGEECQGTDGRDNDCLGMVHCSDVCVAFPPALKPVGSACDELLNACDAFPLNVYSSLITGLSCVAGQCELITVADDGDPCSDDVPCRDALAGKECIDGICADCINDCPGAPLLPIGSGCISAAESEQCNDDGSCISNVCTSPAQQFALACQ